jgi:hypothetical protein
MKMFNKTTKPDPIKIGGEIPKIADVSPRIALEIEPKMLDLGAEKAALIAEQRDLALSETPSSDFLDTERETSRR